MTRLADLLAENLKHGQFWTDAWSLVSGCSPVSPGCASCWLASWSRRFEKGLTNEHGQFKGLVQMHMGRMDKPLRARRPRVYAIWSDLFHTSVSDVFIDHAFSVMCAADRHHFIIVTKRPERAVEYLQAIRRWEHEDGSVFHLGRDGSIVAHRTWPLPNVTILGTVENQELADIRVPHLLRMADAGWRVGILAEPLLGPVDLSRFLFGWWCENCGQPVLPPDVTFEETHDPRFGGCGHKVVSPCPGLQWVIAGGESGPSARITEADWFGMLRDQAAAAGIPFLLKSKGEWVDQYEGMDDCVGLQSCQEADPDDHFQWHEPLPGGVRYYRVGKKHSGALLDCREYKEVPDVTW